MDRYPKIITSSRGKVYTTSKQAYLDFWRLKDKINNMNVFDSHIEQEKQYLNQIYEIACNWNLTDSKKGI